MNPQKGWAAAPPGQKTAGGQTADGERTADGRQGGWMADRRTADRWRADRQQVVDRRRMDSRQRMGLCPPLLLVVD